MRLVSGLFPARSVFLRTKNPDFRPNQAYPSTNLFGCVERSKLSSIPLNQKVFKGIVYRRDEKGVVDPYLRVVDDRGAELYFFIWAYHPASRSGYVESVRLLLDDELEILGIKPE